MLTPWSRALTGRGPRRGTIARATEREMPPPAPSAAVAAKQAPRRGGPSRLAATKSVRLPSPGLWDWDHPEPGKRELSATARNSAEPSCASTCHEPPNSPRAAHKTSPATSTNHAESPPASRNHDETTITSRNHLRKNEASRITTQPRSTSTLALSLKPPLHFLPTASSTPIFVQSPKSI